MKSPKAVAKAASTPSILSQPDTLRKEAAKHAPTPEEIRQRAFEIYCERGGIHGCDLDDWLKAERELLEGTRPAKRSKGSKTESTPPVKSAPEPARRSMETR